MYAVIVGGQGVGKTSLIQRVVDEVKLPVWGLATQKGEILSEEAAGFPVYLQQVGGSGQAGERRLAAYCNRRRIEVRKDAFDDFASLLRKPVPAGHLVLLDELGILENVSPAFCAAVLDLLGRPLVGIVAAKHKESPFLDHVRGHENCRCFRLAQDNREDLYLQVVEFIKGEWHGR